MPHNSQHHSPKILSSIFFIFHIFILAMACVQEAFPINPKTGLGVLLWLPNHPNTIMNILDFILSNPAKTPWRKGLLYLTHSLICCLPIPILCLKHWSDIKCVFRKYWWMNYSLFQISHSLKDHVWKKYFSPWLKQKLICVYNFLCPPTYLKTKARLINLEPTQWSNPPN